MLMFNTHTEKVVKEVLFNKGYVSFEDFKRRLGDGDPTALFELESVIHQSMLEYSKGVERYYEGVNETD